VYKGYLREMKMVRNGKRKEEGEQQGRNVYAK
jgi:hypothetical protein